MIDPKRLHDSSIVIDGHCDTMLDYCGISATDPSMGRRDIRLRSGRGQIDLPRLREAGVTAQFFALFTADSMADQAPAHTWMLLEAFEDLVAGCPDLCLATTAADILAAKAEGRLAGLLAIEGGEALGGSLDSLRRFYKRGVRLLTLTWNRRNALGRGVGEEGTDGLTDFGRAVVAEMDALGMLVDVSHLSDQALEEVLAIATRPLVASHSNARAVCDHRRNLTDAQARRIAATGGLIGLSFAGMFIDEVASRVTMDRFLDHLDHLVQVAGLDHVGLGSDFDGYDPGSSMVLADCRGLLDLSAAMAARGYREESIQKIIGGNWLRLIGEVLV